MNKPQPIFAIEKSEGESLHDLPANHKDTTKELPEVFYKNSKGLVDRVDRKNLESW